MTVDMALARNVLRTEAAAIQGLVDRLDGSFEQAVKLLAACRGQPLGSLTEVKRGRLRGASIYLCQRMG